jgi:hypothetical protein
MSGIDTGAFGALILRILIIAVLVIVLSTASARLLDLCTSHQASTRATTST